jgi:hypothetical protein
MKIGPGGALGLLNGSVSARGRRDGDECEQHRLADLDQLLPPTGLLVPVLVSDRVGHLWRRDRLRHDANGRSPPS